MAALRRFGISFYSSRLSPLSAVSSSIPPPLHQALSSSGLRSRHEFELRSSALANAGTSHWVSSDLTSSISSVREGLTKSSGKNLLQQNVRVCGELVANSKDRAKHLYPFAASRALRSAGGPGLCSQQVRQIYVEVKKNDLDRAIRKWRRRCKEENLKALKDREYYIKPAERRVLARKERDFRIAKGLPAAAELDRGSPAKGILM